MNAERKEMKEAAWKTAHEASIAAANAQKAFFDAIREASEDDLANFLAGRARINEQTQLDQNDGAPTALASPAPKNDARTAPGATNPQATPLNSSDATASSAPAPKAATTKDDSLPRSQFSLDWNPMEDEHKRSPSPFSELPERGCGRLDGCGRPRKNKFKK